MSDACVRDGDLPKSLDSCKGTSKNEQRERAAQSRVLNSLNGLYHGGPRGIDPFIQWEVSVPLPEILKIELFELLGDRGDTGRVDVLRWDGSQWLVWEVKAVTSLGQLPKAAIGAGLQARGYVAALRHQGVDARSWRRRLGIGRRL